MTRDGFTARTALPALAGFWIVGLGLLAASRYGAAGPDRFRQAPTCSPSQTFTTAYCRITVDATLTALTSSTADLDVGGRRTSIETYLKGPLPEVAAGRPVKVTFYRGAAVHLAGDGLDFDTGDAPVDRTVELRFAGSFILAGGSLLIGIRALRRPRSHA